MVNKWSTSCFENEVLHSGTSRAIYRGWLRITEQTRTEDRQRPLSTSGENTRIPWFISFKWAHANHHMSNEKRDIAGYPKVYWHTPTGNDCAHREREKMIFLADKTHENIGADVYNSCEERKKKASIPHRTRVYRQTVYHWIFGKNWCVCGTTLHHQILCALKENAEWNKLIYIGKSTRCSSATNVTKAGFNV